MHAMASPAYLALAVMKAHKKCMKLVMMFSCVLNFV